MREARQLGSGRLIAVFQPHTYSRTAMLFDDTVASLAGADTVLIAPIYAARETDTLGMTPERLAKALPCEARGFDDMQALATYLCRTVRPGNTVVVMGAGDVDRIYAYLPIEKTTKKC